MKLARRAASSPDVSSQQPKSAEGGLSISVKRLMVGYDVFISHARRDASAYAAVLAKELQSLRYAYFLDLAEATVGSPLTTTIQRALNLSRTMVLICSDGANSSHYVSSEVAYFLATGRPIITINIDNALQRSRWAMLLERIFVNETAEAFQSGRPSPVILRSIETSFTLTRRSIVRRRAAIASATVALVLLVGISAAVYEWRQANRIAQLQEELATRQTASRKANALVAVGERLVEADPTKAIDFALASARYAPEQAAVTLIRRSATRMPQYQAFKIEERPGHTRPEVLPEEFYGLKQLWLLHQGDVALIHHRDGNLTSWHVPTGKRIGKLPALREVVLSKADETHAFVLTDAGDVKSIRVRGDGTLSAADISGKFQGIAADAGETRAIAWTADGHAIDLVRRVDLPTMTEKPIVSSAAAVNDTSKSLALLSGHGDLQLIDLASGNARKSKLAQAPDASTTPKGMGGPKVVFLPAVDALVAALEDEDELSVQVVDLPTMQTIWSKKAQFTTFGADVGRNRFGLLSGAVTQYSVHREAGGLTVAQDDQWSILPGGGDAGEAQGLIYGPFGRYVATLNAPILRAVQRSL